jgi:hypothetical protein
MNFRRMELRKGEFYSKKAEEWFHANLEPLLSKMAPKYPVLQVSFVSFYNRIDPEEFRVHVHLKLSDELTISLIHDVLLHPYPFLVEVGVFRTKYDIQTMQYNHEYQDVLVIRDENEFEEKFEKMAASFLRKEKTVFEDEEMEEFVDLLFWRQQKDGNKIEFGTRDFFHPSSTIGHIKFPCSCCKNFEATNDWCQKKCKWYSK